MDKIISVANMYFKPDARISDEEYLRTYNVFRLGDIAFEGNKSKNFAFGRFVENTIGDGIVSHVFVVFRPLHHDHNLGYWKYAINNENVMGRILARCTKKTTMMTNLVSDDFLEEEMFCPSNAEQRKISSFLELLERKIDAQIKLVEHLKKYKRGVYKNIFATSRLDCTWVSLGELCEIITKGTTPHSFLSNGTIRYIKIESIVDGHIVNENCKFIDEDTHEGALSRSILKEGDILFSIAGSLGVCVIVQQFNLPANTNQALAIIRLKGTENRNYILSVLRSSLMEEYILASRTTGAQPNLSLQQMRDFKLPYPNADEQQKIALFADRMEKKLNLEQRKLEKLLDVKSALLQQLFI